MHNCLLFYVSSIFEHWIRAIHFKMLKSTILCKKLYSCHINKQNNFLKFFSMKDFALKDLPGCFFSFTNISEVQYSVHVPVYRYVHYACLVVKHKYMFPVYVVYNSSLSSHLYGKGTCRWWPRPRVGGEGGGGFYGGMQGLL